MNFSYKQKNQSSFLTKEKFIIGSQFTLQASATAVKERPSLKKDVSSNNLQFDVLPTGNNSFPWPVSAQDGITLSGTVVSAMARKAEERGINKDRLNLDRCQLSACLILDGEDQLRLLNYQHNTIQRIENMDMMRRLIFLDFYDNQIDRISGLESLKSLRVLMLGKNRIKRIENLDAIDKLDVLDLHGNQIKVIENLSHLSELRVLNLAGNIIDTVGCLRGMNSLTELNLRRNMIQTVMDVDLLPNLQRLFLSFNDISSFDDICCVSYTLSLFELCLDGNPLCQDLTYKQTILRHVQQLKQLDMKRITEDERRIAVAVGKRDEEKKKEHFKIAAVQDKRCQTINKARQQWEAEHQATTQTYSFCEDNLTELRACHVANVPNTDRSEASIDNNSDFSSGRTSSSKSIKSDRDGVISTVHDNSVRISIGTTTRVDSPDRPDTRSANDSLSEIDGDTLNLYGLGSLEAFDKSWGMQAAGAVTTVAFEFVDFNEITKVLHKIRIRFPNVVTLIFDTTNISALSQLNALSAVRRLDAIIIQPDGNPVTRFVHWRNYLLFRFAHFNLKKINGSEVGISDIVEAELFFSTLGNTLSSKLPHARLVNLLGDRRKQLLNDDKTKKLPTEVTKVPTSLEKTENIGRALLSHIPTKEYAHKLQESRTRRSLIHDYVQSQSADVVQANKKHTILVAHWQHVLTELVKVSILDMWDISTYIYGSLGEIEKSQNPRVQKK